MTNSARFYHGLFAQHFSWSLCSYRVHAVDLILYTPNELCVQGWHHRSHSLVVLTLACPLQCGGSVLRILKLVSLFFSIEKCYKEPELAISCYDMLLWGVKAPSASCQSSEFPSLVFWVASVWWKDSALANRHQVQNKLVSGMRCPGTEGILFGSLPVSNNTGFVGLGMQDFETLSKYITVQQLACGLNLDEKATLRNSGETNMPNIRLFVCWNQFERILFAEQIFENMRFCVQSCCIPVLYHARPVHCTVCTVGYIVHILMMLWTILVATIWTLCCLFCHCRQAREVPSFIFAI